MFYGFCGGEDGGRGGVTFRYRRSLSYDTGKREWGHPHLELSIGPTLFGDHGYRKYPGAIANAALNVGDRISIMLQTELTRFAPNPWITKTTDVGWYAGIKAGSRTGRVTALIFIAILGVAAAMASAW